MKTTRTYPKLYYACKGDGWIPTTGTSLDTTKQCPVCKGTGIITVTEIIEENENKDIRRNTKKL